MNWTISLLITIFLIFLGIIFRKNKVIWGIQILWIWILLSFNTGGSDWNVHKHFFVSSINGFSIFSSAWLYQLICYPFAKLGIDFFYMNFIVSTIALIFYLRLIYKNSDKYCFVTSLFMIFPLADSIIQKRNFLACIIFLYGVFKVLNEEKNYTLKYTIYTLIAAQIHSAFYIYLVFIPFLSCNIKSLKKYIPMFTIIAFCMIPFFPYIAKLLLGSTSLAFKVDYYFKTFKIPFYQSCCWWILHLVFYFIFKKFSNSSYGLSEKEQKMKLVLDKLNLLLLLLIPLYYYEATFFRLYRNLLLVNYIFLGKYIYKNNKWTKDMFFGTAVTVCFITLVFCSQFVMFGLGFDFLVKPLFENNLVIGDKNGIG